jgi:signal transduction histidine kinase
MSGASEWAGSPPARGSGFGDFMTDTAIASAREGSRTARTAPATRLALAILMVIGVNAPVAVAEGPLWTQKPAMAAVNLLVSLGLVGMGRVLVGQPGQQGTGVALILSGFAFTLGWADIWPSGPLPWFTYVLADAGVVLAAWALLRYPDPRLRRPGRLYLSVLAAWVIGGPAALTILGRPGWLGSPAMAWWPPTLADRALLNQANWVFTTGAAVLAAGFLVLITRRAVIGSPQDRAVRLPVVAAGFVAAVAAAVTTVVTTARGASYTVFIINGMAELGIPVAFLVAFGQQRQRQLTRLVTDAGAHGNTVDRLIRAVQATLQDPTVTILRYCAADKAYHTVGGQPVTLADLPADVTAEPVTSADGRPLAVVTRRRRPGTSGPFLRPAATLAALVLEKLQLAEEKTELSRRVLTAEYDTRERIAKDIHDGVQLDLQALMQKLALIRVVGEDLRSPLAEAVELAGRAVAGLHDFVHDVYPVTLKGSGLKATVVEMVSQLDLLIRVSVLNERLPEDVERAFWFVIREAVTNVVKHADATTVDIIVQRSGDWAQLRIRDDGRGGADLSGTGIGNMRDRIATLGGTLSIDSPVTLGTRIEGEISCA